MHRDKTPVYILPWVVLLEGLKTFGPHPEIWPLYAALPAAGALGSWPPLRPAPAQSAILGTSRHHIYMQKKLAESCDGLDRKSVV